MKERRGMRNIGKSRNGDESHIVIHASFEWEEDGWGMSILANTRFNERGKEILQKRKKD